MSFPGQSWGGQQPQQGFQQAQQPTGPAPATQSVEDYWKENTGRGGGAPSFNFTPETPGVKGTIVDMQARQRTEFRKDGSVGPLKFYPDGKPQMQLEVTLQTDLRGWAAVSNIPGDTNPQTGQVIPRSPEMDDGKRRIYVWYTLRDAITEAITENGGNAPKVGDMLAVWVIGTQPNPKGDKPIKLYKAALQPGSPAANQFFGDAPQAPPAQPAATQQAQQQAWGGPPPQPANSAFPTQGAQTAAFQAPGTGAPQGGAPAQGGWDQNGTQDPPF